MTLDEQKSHLRAVASAAVAALGSERAGLDAAIAAAIIASVEFGEAEQLLAYKGLADEVPIEAVIEAADQEVSALALQLKRPDEIQRG